MPINEELVRYVGMSYEDTARLSERLAMDRSSVLYASLRGALATKLVMMKQCNEAQQKRGRRRRLVIAQTMDPEQSHNMLQAFGEFDLVFKNSERVEGGYTSAVFAVTVEKLFNFTRGNWAPVVCFGFSVNHLIVHNRSYAHLCVPNESVHSMCKTVADDRAMCAILNSARDKGKPFPLMERYANGDMGDMVCSDPVSCTKRAKVSVVMLTGVDTNYLQLCSFMTAHSTALMYFAFPCSKATELRYDAAIPELDAYVKHEGDKFHILYKNATSMGQTYTYDNHLTLIGKTYETIGKYTFHKEYVGHQLGMSMYKITRALTKHRAPDVVYRSWFTPGYKNRYLMKSFELKSEFADPYKASSYEVYQFETDANHVDRLLEDAMMLPDDAFTHGAIARKLRVYATNHVQAGYSVVSNGYIFKAKEFSHIVLIVYCHVFMTRYVQGVTAAFVSNDARKMAYWKSAGIVKLIPMVLYTVVIGQLQLGLSKVKSMLVSLFDRFFNSRTPIGSIQPACDFHEYRDMMQPVRWSSVKSWAKLLERPWKSFSPYLTGFEQAVACQGYTVSMNQYNFWAMREVRVVLEQKITGRLRPLALPSVMKAAKYSVSESGITVTSDPGAYQSTVLSPTGDMQLLDDYDVLSDVSSSRRDGMLMTTEPVKRGVVVDEPNVQALATKVAGDGENLRDLAMPEYYRPRVLVQPEPFRDTHAGADDDPISTLKMVLGTTFRGSTLMQTEHFAGDILKSDFQMVAKAAMIAITSAKLRVAKADVVYKPKMPNQVMPNAKQDLTSVLYAVTKRNLNAMSSVDPLDLDEMWHRTWRFMREVYYVPGVDERLARMPSIAPTVETAAVWASKLEPKARQGALQVSYCLETLDPALQNSTLMLKGKRKPNLGPSYDDSVKASQSIQYDPSKARVGVYSPIFAEKVRRDQSVLNERTFIMQSKSKEDLNEFLSRFPWLPDGNGPIKYIMLDGEMFDKSQITSTLAMHWKKCEKFGVLPRYVDVLRNNSSMRTASSIAAGIKAFLTAQRGTGDSDTLDGNSDVSQAAYARFLHRIRDKIVFILIMGDDVTIAYRGDVDTQSVESDCMKEFNLSVKLTLSPFGDFVSGWLVHMPDGSIQWHTDPVKRAVSLGDQSVSEQVDFREKWEGFNDLCKGLSGMAVQTALSAAISYRYSKELGISMSVQDALRIVRAVATVSEDFDKFRSFYAESTTRRYN